MTEHNGNENALWTPANIVTLVRILLVPVFVVAILSPWPDYFPNWEDIDLYKPWVAALIFAVISCTDALDGYLARSRGEVTNFGKFIDPLADKILVAAALLALIELQVLPSWVALIIIVREFIVSGLRMLVASQGIVIAASWYGKAKTVFQIIAILLFIIKDSDLLLRVHVDAGWTLYIVSWLFMIVALVLTIVSMVDYFVKCAPLLGFGANKKNKKADAFYISQAQSSQPSPSVEEQPHGECADAIEETQTYLQAQEVINLARAKGLHIATAESCTGGLIGGALTAIPGSSDVVEGGIISYSNDVKLHLLNVSPDDLANVGAVSSEVAAAMAFGALEATKSNIAVSVTGIAGPGGATEGKPVGTVWFGVATHVGVSTEVQHFSGTRAEVRAATVSHALSLLHATLSD